MSQLAVSAVVTDIEGTTGSIAFVKDVLFPYAERRMKAFVAAHPDVAAPMLADARVLLEAPGLSDAAVADEMLAWSRADRKIGPLKALQGKIWAEGYRSGELKGHVYPDAVVALRGWHARGLPLYVYSSGSVEAQKLLFGHTEFGDLTPLFSGYFDTGVGGKLEAASYTAIAREFAKPPERLLFLSDHAGEIAAAREAGWQALVVDRGGHAVGAIASFDEIELEILA